MTEPDLFTRLGGVPTIARLVDAFYDTMERRAEFAALRALHAPELGPTRDVLKLYLTEWTGGPADYSAAKGHPRLRRRHMHIRIGTRERDEWLACMALALAATVADEPVRAVLAEKFAKLADWMRNQPGNPHDAGAAYGSTAPETPQPHDCRHVASSTVENPTNCGCAHG